MGLFVQSQDISYRSKEGILEGKNTVVMSAGPSNLQANTFPAILDRSPCGSGTAAVMANLWHKGQLKLGTTHFNQSPTFKQAPCILE